MMLRTNSEKENAYIDCHGRGVIRHWEVEGIGNADTMAER